MKRLFAAALSAVLLLSMAACGNNSQKEEEKTQSYYVLTSKKHYTKDKLTSSAEFTYDQKGRPLTAKIEANDSLKLETELTYDEYGSKSREVYSYTDLRRDISYTMEENYEMTYQDGKLIHCNIVNINGGTTGFSLQYDEAGRLICVDYDVAEGETTHDVRYTYVYDEQGRLIQETRYSGMYYSQDSVVFVTDSEMQMRYQYGERNNVFYTEYSGRVTYPEGTVDIPQVELTKSEYQYNYCFGDDGRVIYVGTDEEDIYQESYGTLKDDECYTFDEYGNLLCYASGDYRTEYTYEKRELTKAEVEMAIRWGHGFSSFMAQYAVYGMTDPIYFNVAPIAYYAPYLKSPAYHLVPCPLWYMPTP